MLRVILACVTSERRRLAFGAQLYSRFQTGSRQAFLRYGDVSRLESMLQGLVLEARNEKRKTCTIMLDSIVPGLHGGDREGEYKRSGVGYGCDTGAVDGGPGIGEL